MSRYLIYGSAEWSMEFSSIWYGLRIVSDKKISS